MMRSISILLLTCSLSAVKAAPVEHLFTEEGNLPPIPSNITIGAYYYPWHGDDFHRNDGYLRDQLDPRHQPTLGEYDDTKPEVIAQHLAWSRQANINLWVTSFWGAGSREDNTIRNNILTHSDLGDHKIALLYESTGRMKASEGYSTQRLGPDMAHMCKNIFPHPNYYRVDGRPVVMLYVTRALYNYGVLEQLVEALRTSALEECGQEVFLIGDQVWGEPPQENEEYPPFSMLDAVTNYDVYGNMNGAPYAGQAVVDRYYKEQERWKGRAAQDGVRYIPAVSPGYNDRGVRLQADHPGGSRRLTADDEPGSLFVAQLQKARYLVDDSMDRLILVNSFNEWHEDSQIEPAIGEPTTLPLHLTGGLEYEGYGELYLNILRVATCDSSCDPINQKRGLPLPGGPSSGQMPSDLLVGAYYYAWYGSDFNGGAGYLRSQLDRRQGPVLGEYDDTESQVVSKHLKWSRQANIGLWVTSWRGPTHPIDSTIRNVILPHPELGDHKIALLYEIGTRMSENDDWDTSRVASDLEYISDFYFSGPNYFRVGGRPVIFLSLTRKLFSVSVLERVTVLMRTIAETFGHDIYLVGDQVWNSAPTEEIYMPFLLLDAVTNLDIYGNMISPGLAGQEAVDDYYDKQKDWRNRAWSFRCGFIPAVTPGFNDRGLKPLAQHKVLSRELTAESQPGSLFAASVDKAKYLVDSELSNLMLVNSFNQWHEDTQIEPATGMDTSSPGTLTAGNTYYGYGDLYLDLLRNATLGAPSSSSGEYHDSEMFHPLRCNTDVGLSEKPCDKTWLSSFGNSDSHLLEVVVPCGECIMLDYQGPVLKLEGGIDIQGKLMIPDGIEIIIKTPYVRVQGELHMNSTKVIDGVPGITFLLFEGDEGIEKFLPASSNEHVCGIQRCDPGPQSIMVAGGRVVINGLPAETPTWVNIIDVVSTAEEPPIPVPTTCPVNGVYINEGFEFPHPSAFTGTPGAFVEFDGASMKVLDRTSIHHGVQLDLKAVNECLATQTPYTWAVKLRLIKPQYEGDYSSCSKSGENCLAVHAEYSSDEEALGSSLKYKESVGSNVRYGEWFEINEEFIFDEREVDTSNIYLTMRISGAEPGVDLEVDSLSLRLSVDATCSRSPPDCRDLIACNGDGEDGEDESPFYPEGNAEISLQVEEGNSFWNAVRLSSDSAIAGIGWRVPDSCFKESAVYKFRMRIRVHPNDDSPEEIFTAVYIRSHREGPDTQRRITICPPSSGEWVSCETYFTVPPDMLGDLKFVRMFIETVGSSSVMYDIDDLSFEFVHMEAPVNGLVVDGNVKDKWGVGAEILITSHTLNWNDQTVRAIASVKKYGDEGKLLIELNATIDARPPTTSDSSFAAEVALLSRNIVFEGSRESKDGPLQGGHLVVYHTVAIPQIIEGAEFRNFGQQGTLGRYPIYFHHSQSAAGSVVSKNTIRESNQRCIVLAGTNDVLVEENIAYDTAGHCFVLQDGMESGNIFRRNLGALTRKVDVVIPNNGSSGRESDDLPSTYFITNSSNTWEGNVGAGSEGNAFGIVLQDSVKGLHASEYTTLYPSSLPLTLFKDNVAHSNRVEGFHVSMTSAYRPEPSPFELAGLRAYRNMGIGMLIMDSEHVSLKDATFSDNRRAIHVQRSESVSISDTTIVGLSQEHRLLEATQSGAPKLCPSRTTVVGGIEIPSYTPTRDGGGMMIENTSILGFSNLGCNNPYAFKINTESGWGVFDYFSSFSGIDVEEGTTSFQLCDAFQASIKDVYLIDRDGSLGASLENTTRVASLVGQNGDMLTFIPEEKCREMDGCYFYCKDTCLRTVSFSVDPAITQDYKLRICERANLEKCVLYDGHNYTEWNDVASQVFALYSNHYYAALPAGQYEAVFLDADGKEAWPTFVETTYHDASCQGGVEDGMIWLQKPPPTQNACSTLLRNGNAEADGTSHLDWVAGTGGIQVVQDAGMGSVDQVSSQALCDTSPDVANSTYFVGQYIDTRCLIQDRLYTVEAWVRISDITTNTPIVADCNTNSECPKVGIHFADKHGMKWAIELDSSNNVFSSLSSQSSGSYQADFDGGYQRFIGTFSVDLKIAYADSAFFYIVRNDKEDGALCVDNVSIVLT